MNTSDFVKPPRRRASSCTVRADVRRVEPCRARRGAYKTRTWRTRHFWSGTDRCVWCGKTKAEVGAAPNKALTESGN